MTSGSQMFNSYLWFEQINLIMPENWTLSRRKFLAIAGTTTAGLMLSTELYALSGELPVVRFGMLSDVHYANREPAGTRFYNQSLTKVQEAIDRMNQEKLDFVIELGDFKDQDEVPNEANTLKYLIEIEAVFQKFNGPHITFWVITIPMEFRNNNFLKGLKTQVFPIPKAIIHTI